MKRSKWKLYQSHKREASVGNYLSVIDKGMWRAQYEPGGGHDMWWPTFWRHRQRLGYRNINSHITDGPGEWRSKRAHSDLTTTHQNTIDSKTSLRDSKSNYITIVYAIEHWIKPCSNKKMPAGVSGFFIDIKSFRSHYGPGVDSASNRSEYRVYFLGVKAAGA